MAIQFTDTLVSRAGLVPTVFPPEELLKIRRGWNCRIDLRQIEELAHEIAASPLGQHTPGSVRKGEGGHPYTVDGNRRLEAILYINQNLDMFRTLYPHLAGPLPYKAYVLTCNEDEAMEITLSAALDRMGLSPMDKAQSLRDCENRGWDDKRIARVLKCSTTYLPTLRSYLSLPAEAQKELHDGVLTGDLAKSLVGLPEAEVKETVAKVKAGKVKPAEAKRQVNAGRRKKGEKVTLSMKELRDELDTMDDLDLAFDLANFIAGESTYESLRELIELYNVQVHENGNGNGNGSGHGAHGKEGA